MLKMGCYLTLALNSEYASIFYRTSNLLSDEYYQEAVKFVAEGGNKKVDKYKNLMDFIFCELNPDGITKSGWNKWANKCKNYYNDKGPNLSEDPDFNMDHVDELDEYFADHVLPTLRALYDENSQFWWRSVKCILNVVGRVKDHEN